MSDDSDPDNFVVKKVWRLVRKLGGGSYGDIFLGVHKRTKRERAIKMEFARYNCLSQLRSEYYLFRSLRGKVGIPAVYWFGKDGEQDLYNALVMELLGPSLEDLFVYCDCRFSVKTTVMLADQMLRRIVTLHHNFLIHRDIKPDNFVMGTGPNFNTLYVIDFGLTKHYMDPVTRKHNQFRDSRSLTGTARYCSINSHAGYELSRRDDLESLAYVLIYFLSGSLPWQGIPADNKKDKVRKIYAAKQEMQPENLSEIMPPEFGRLLHICRSMEYEEEPNYANLFQLFWRVLQKRQLKYDCQFDWLLK